MEIDENTNIAELLEKHPETAEVFMNYDLQCVGCMAAAFDTIGHGADAHGLSEEDIQALIEDLNLVVNLDVDPEKISEDSAPAQ